MHKYTNNVENMPTKFTTFDVLSGC